MQILVQTLSGETFTLGCDLDTHIESLKRRLSCRTDIHWEQQQLAYGPTQLENGRKLSDYHVKDGAILNMVVLAPFLHILVIVVSPSAVF